MDWRGKDYKSLTLKKAPVLILFQTATRHIQDFRDGEGVKKPSNEQELFLYTFWTPRASCDLLVTPAGSEFLVMA